MRFSPYFKKLVLSVAVTLATASAASAHYYWVYPNAFFFPKARPDRLYSESLPEYLSFDFSGSETFFQPDLGLGLTASDYTVSITGPDGLPVPLTGMYYGRTKMTADAALPEEGTYTISVVRLGSPIYFSNMHNGSYLRLSKDQLSKSQRSQLDHASAAYQSAKAFVVVHEVSDGWKKPVGQPLELMPLSDPSAVKKGEPFKVQLLYRGKPLPKATLEGVYETYRQPENGKMPIETQTDDQGTATVTFDRDGRWLLHARYELDSPDKEKADKFTYKAGLMLDVQPAGKAP